MKSTISALVLSTVLVSGETILVPTNPPPSVKLAWNASLTTNYGTLSYVLYYGPVSRTYTNKVFAGTNLSITVPSGGRPYELIRGATYYFTVTALATNGLESDWSNEVNYTPPLPPEAPTMKPIVVLTVQTKSPTENSLWADAGMYWALSADQAEQLFRLKIENAPKVTVATPQLFIRTTTVRYPPKP